MKHTWKAEIRSVEMKAVREVHWELLSEFEGIVLRSYGVIKTKGEPIIPLELIDEDMLLFWLPGALGDKYTELPLLHESKSALL